MERIPALFIGHGSPMNAIEDNRFSRQWMRLGERLPTPKAILSVSAHWFTTGTLVNNHPAPQMIYDMYGFPQALYQGCLWRSRRAGMGAARTRELLGAAVRFDNSWGAGSRFLVRIAQAVSAGRCSGISAERGRRRFAPRHISTWAKNYARYGSRA